MAGYRLSPKVQFPQYVEDLAASVKWVVDNAAKLGGDPNRIFVGGHSAEATSRPCLPWIRASCAKPGYRTKASPGFIPTSGQMMTHFTVRKERGVANSQASRPPMKRRPFFIFARTPLRFSSSSATTTGPPASRRTNISPQPYRKSAKMSAVSLLVVPDRDHGSIVNKCLEPGDPAGQAVVGNDDQGAGIGGIGAADFKI